MILSDREIQIALQNDQIIIDPTPKPEAFSSTSLDLTLDEKITRFKRDPSFTDVVIDPSHPDYNHGDMLKAYSEQLDIPSAGFELPPGELILAWTVEEVRLPVKSRIAARVEGKSSLARLGLCVHMTAPTIHAGFEGPIQLEVINHGVRKIRLKTGMRICQLIFESTLGTPLKGYHGQFFGQGG